MLLLNNGSIMKIVYFTFLAFLYLSFCSCSEQDESSSDMTIEVVFKANSMVANEAQNSNELSVITFKSDESGIFSFLSNEDNTNWVSEENGTMTKKILLSTGKYRFLMARGFSSDASDKNSILFLKEEGVTGGYDCDYYFKYPSDDNEKRLKPCSTELFIDSNEPGFESNQTDYSLFEGNKFSVSRKVTRLQGRLDFMIRRGEWANGKLKPISEGDNNEDALANALNKIESIQVTAGNISTRCHVDGLICSTPGSYIFDLPKSDFVPFKSKDFVSELKGIKQSDYSGFDNSAYKKGPLLFSAPEDGEISLDMTITYKAPLQPKKIVQEVELKRNKVALVILWLLNEEIGIDVTVDQDNLVFGDGTANGDDGFWN